MMNNSQDNPGSGDRMRKRIFATIMKSPALVSALGGCLFAQTPFPTVDRLPEIPDLPDPFLMAGGKRVATVADWRARREEIKAMILHYQYGRMPPAPGNIQAREISSQAVFSGKGTQKVVELTMGPDNRVKFQVGLTIPIGAGPFPIIIKNDRGVNMSPALEEGLDRRFIIADYNRHMIDQDDANRSDGVHPVYPGYSWGTLAAWAWGTHRVVDYVLTLPLVDKDKIIITGQSRGGKAALLAGALDERIAVVAPNGSGEGGCGLHRFQEQVPIDVKTPTTTETLDRITSVFPYWFVPELKTFALKESRLPFDQHFVKALVAPRAFLCNDALGDVWANPVGNSQANQAAQEVYEFLGAGSRIGIHFRPGEHAQTAEDWSSIMDFAEWQLMGKATTTNFRNNYFPDMAKGYTWVRPAPVPVPVRPARPAAKGAGTGIVRMRGTEGYAYAVVGAPGRRETHFVSVKGGRVTLP